MITVKVAEEIHRLLIENFGGYHGTRDFSGLDSALFRPFYTFGEIDLYTDPNIMHAEYLVCQR